MTLLITDDRDKVRMHIRLLFWLLFPLVTMSIHVNLLHRSLISAICIDKRLRLSLTGEHRWTFLRRRRRTARARSAGSTPCIRLPNTRRGRTALLPRASGVMIANNQDMVARQSLCSTKRWGVSSSVILMNVTTQLWNRVWWKRALWERPSDFIAKFFLAFQVVDTIILTPRCPQAKTTKKIVLRLQCQGCKHVSQHPIKVGQAILL